MGMQSEIHWLGIGTQDCSLRFIGIGQELKIAV